MKKFSKLLLTLIICLFSTPLFAQEAVEIDLDYFLTQKKALIKDTVQFTAKEDKAFWQLYDEYMQTYVKLLKRRIDFAQGLFKAKEAISDERAKTIVDEHFAIVSDSLKAKMSMLKKLRKLLPEKKVLKFFQLEEKIEIGFLFGIADTQPLVK